MSTNMGNLRNTLCHVCQLLHSFPFGREGIHSLLENPFRLHSLEILSLKKSVLFSENVGNIKEGSGYAINKSLDFKRSKRFTLPTPNLTSQNIAGVEEKI
jgi:hypothetical protein